MDSKGIKLTRYVHSTLALLVLVATSSCGGNFLGSNGSKSGGGFSGGQRKDPSSGNQIPNGQDPNGINGANSGAGDPDGWGGLRQDVAVDYGNDAQNLYVSATINYNGDNSGDDALFKFYLQRITPAPEKFMREIVQARGQGKSDSKVLDKVCRCGKKSTFWFFWEHQSGGKGALHSKTYQSETRMQGDWILDHYVSDKKWYRGNLTSVPQGKASMFLGADTENPAAFMGVNSSGAGYLRTWYYHPNSIELFATKEHRWDSRDDMRIGLTCDVNQCPAELKDATEIEIVHHISHDPAWKLP